MSLRHLLPLVTLVFVGCGGPSIIRDREGELDIVQAPLRDLGAAPVGVPQPYVLELQAFTADVQVRGVNILTMDDSRKVFYTYREWENLGYTIPEDWPGREAGRASQFTVKATDAEPTLWGFVYYSPVEGYHHARFTFRNDGDESEVGLEVRARAATTEVAIYPWVVDCGMLTKGQRRNVYVTVDNRGAIPAAISTNFEDPTQFFSEEADPLILEAGVKYQYEITCEPRIDGAQQSRVAFTLGETSIGSVKILINDCENGIPSAYDQDGDGFSACYGIDCDDTRPEVRPGAVEVADGLDNDCNGLVDDNTPGFDDDGDGYCDHPTQCYDDHVLPGDCNDGHPLINPGVKEDCPDDNNPLCADGMDNDCDRIADGGSLDFDGDGFTEEGGDCDPYDGDTAPGKPEKPDGKDNDCDGIKDEGTVLYDDDGDGYCEGMINRPPGLAPCSNASYIGTGDCDDSTDPISGVHPGAWVYPDAPESPADGVTNIEMYRGIDNDCDGKVDEGTIWYDDDGDGSTEEAGDCDDANPNVGPHALEIPGNGIDDDCNPATPASGPK